MDPELTLEKAKTTVRQNEAVKAQHLQLCGDSEGTKKDPIVLHEVKGTHRHSDREPQDWPDGRKPCIGAVSMLWSE